MNRITIALAVLLVGTMPFIAACDPVRDATGETTLYFYSEDDLEQAFFDHPVAVTRVVDADDPLDDALRQLFAGPTEEERSRGARMSTDLRRLADFYIGVSKEGSAAIVNFRPEALGILNSAAARQFMVKSPIRATLEAFPEITEVRYAIDGEIFEEWDA